MAHRQAIKPDGRPCRIEQGRALGHGRQGDVLHDLVDRLRLAEPRRHDPPQPALVLRQGRAPVECTGDDLRLRRGNGPRLRSWFDKRVAAIAAFLTDLTRGFLDRFALLSPVTSRYGSRSSIRQSVYDFGLRSTVSPFARSTNLANRQSGDREGHDGQTARLGHG